MKTENLYCAENEDGVVVLVSLKSRVIGLKLYDWLMLDFAL